MADGGERIPFLRPKPPALTNLARELRQIEASGIYSNFGPVSRRAEAELTQHFFGGLGASLLVNNATSGLMLAVRESFEPGADRRYALMPAFTFAATAHAAIWAGLTPLFCDIDPDRWIADPAAEDELLERYRGQIACVVPYACFGTWLDLERYERLSRDHGVGIVIDAAASLGTTGVDGNGFGTGSSHAVVFSMHATKTFATAEAGLVYSADPERLARLRAMSNFGFVESRSASLPGLNAKLTEYGALLVLARLREIDAVVAHRAALSDAYRDGSPWLTFQEHTDASVVYQFMPVLLPASAAAHRAAYVDALTEAGIGHGTYFSPHLAQQPYFADRGRWHDLNVTEQVAARSISLPMADDMPVEDVATVTATLNAVRAKLGD